MTAQIVAGRKLIKKHMALIPQSLKREIIYKGLQPHFSINSIIFVISGLPSWPQNLAAMPQTPRTGSFPELFTGSANSAVSLLSRLIRSVNLST
jgi:hypothetical protein